MTLVRREQRRKSGEVITKPQSPQSDEVEGEYKTKHRTVTQEAAAHFMFPTNSRGF